MHETEGLGDPTPFLTLRTRCSCGQLISERRYDARLIDGYRPEVDADLDAGLMLAHLARVDEASR
jgi:hypothetical protein